MNIQIRLAKNDYESVIKIMSQVQELYKKCGFTEKSINMELLGL